jgi:hypothetical protein
MSTAIRPPEHDETPLSPSEAEILHRILMSNEPLGELALSYPHLLGEQS